MSLNSVLKELASGLGMHRLHEEIDRVAPDEDKENEEEKSDAEE
jgi:hypothetical protein